MPALFITSHISIVHQLSAGYLLHAPLCHFPSRPSHFSTPVHIAYIHPHLSCPVRSLAHIPSALAACWRCLCCASPSLQNGRCLSAHLPLPQACKIHAVKCCDVWQLVTISYCTYTSRKHVGEECSSKAAAASLRNATHVQMWLRGSWVHHALNWDSSNNNL